SLWMVPTIGMRRSFLTAAAINVVIALAALWVSRHLPDAMASASTPSATRAQSAALSAQARAAVLAVIAASGAVSLALEVVWFRVLVFFLRPTTYAFASMLAAVLIGLAL